MRNLFLLGLISCCTYSFAQDTDSNSNDTLFDSGIFFSASMYMFAYDMDIEDGSAAVGPSFLFGDNRINFQIGVLVDFKTYYTWESTHFYARKHARTNILIPWILNVNYLRKPKTVYSVSIGFVLGGNFTGNSILDRESRDAVAGIAGIGISHSASKRLIARASLNVRYVLQMFSPGVALDIIIPLKPK